VLAAVLARIIPADHDPGALELGVEAFVRERMALDQRLADEVSQLLNRLPSDFGNLDSNLQDELLQGDSLNYLAQIAWEGALANNEPGLKMVGFYELV